MEKVFILILLVFQSIIGFSQNFKANSKVSLMIAMDDLNSSTISYVKENNNVNYLAVVYGDHIYPNNSRKFNRVTLRKEIEKLFPDPNSKGYGMLDWEGPVYNTLVGLSKDDVKYNESLNEFLNTLRFAKQLRPNVKWGFFNIPLRRNFYKTISEWDSYISKLTPLIQESDVLYMAFYKNYKVQDPNVESIKKMIQLSQKYGVQSYAVVWDRFDSIDKSIRHDLIPKSEFIEYMDNILKIQNNGNYINGIVWWGRDTWFYNANKNKLPVARRSLNNFKSDYNKRVRDYVREIIK